MFPQVDGRQIYNLKKIQPPHETHLLSEDSEELICFQVLWLERLNLQSKKNTILFCDSPGPPPLRRRADVSTRWSDFVFFTIPQAHLLLEEELMSQLDGAT
jgi:hypothetical protein